MKLNVLINEQEKVKYSLNVPKQIINKLNFLAAIEKNTTKKKRIQEFKGILIGKYPTLTAMYSSFVGIKKKLSSLNEAKLSTSQKITAGTMAFLMTILGIMLPALGNLIKTEKAVRAQLEQPNAVEQPAVSQTQAHVLVIEIKQTVWNKIEKQIDDYIKGLIAKDYTGTEAHKELAKLAKKLNVNFNFQLTTNQLGSYSIDKNTVNLNFDLLRRFALGEVSLDKIKSVLYHELTHREQANKLMKIMGTDAAKKFFKDSHSRQYYDRALEIGAFHKEIKRAAIKYGAESNEFKKILEPYASISLKHILALYPENDRAVQAIKKVNPHYDNVMPSHIRRFFGSEESAKMAREIVGNLSELQMKENIMNWKEKVAYYLGEAKDPDRVAGGYKALATRLTKDLGKKVTPGQVKSYLKKMEKQGISGKIKDSAKDPEVRVEKAYEYAAKYKVLKAAFSKR